MGLLGEEEWDGRRKGSKTLTLRFYADSRRIGKELAPQKQCLLVLMLSLQKIGQKAPDLVVGG
jgi:hypothetical protein